MATAALAPQEIAWPIRSLMRDQSNATVIMAEARDVDIGGKHVVTDLGPFTYDVLVLATGASHSYFGNDGWAQYAPGLKTLRDAAQIREKLLLVFEAAERSEDPEEMRRLMRFAVIGGGPTGVELAGAIADVAKNTLSKDFRRIDPGAARIVLIEPGKRLLSTYPASASDYAQASLEAKGVTVMLDAAVEAVQATQVKTSKGTVEAATIVWAAGVSASPAAHWLKAEHDSVGRVLVTSTLNLPGREDIFVIGDTAALNGDRTSLPGIAPVAKQMGRYVGARIKRSVTGKDTPSPFSYRHAGDLATIGRNAAIVRLPGIELRGWIGWLFWSVAHIWFLIDVRNRIAVSFTWAWDYLTYQRSARLIFPPAKAIDAKIQGPPDKPQAAP